MAQDMSLAPEGPAALLAEPKIPALGKKLVLTVATTGSFIRHEHNPAQPYYPPEIAEQVISSYELGASVWHVHTRDAAGNLSTDYATIIEAADLVLEKCPDILLSQTGHWALDKRGTDGVKSLVEPLLEEGAKRNRRYIHTVVVNPATVGRQQMDRADVQDTVSYLLAQGIVPEFQNHDSRAIRNVQDWLIDAGLLTAPYVMNLLMGYHGARFISSTGPDPWGHIQLMTMMEMLPSGSVIGATVGGRRWLPLTTTASLLGADCVRIGMEDSIWMYPHQDVKIGHSKEAVRKIATIARELGRDIATPAEAARLLGCAQ